MKRNSVKNLPVIQGKVLVQPFEWGSDITPLISQESNGFDIVVAADCIYYKEVRYCQRSITILFVVIFYQKNQSLDSFVKTLEDLSQSGEAKTEIYISYEERESEEKKNLIGEFLVKIQNNCSVHKIPFDEYREDFRCEDIHIYKIVAK